MAAEASASPAPADPPREERVPADAVAAVALLLACAVAYAGSLSAPFTLDDLVNFVDVPSLHMVRLDAASVARATGGFPFGRWLARLTFALNHLVGGKDPFGYHLVNVAFHAGASLLVYALAIEVLARTRGGGRERARRPALLAALLFALHPVHTQAVTYVVQRMTSMGAFFGLCALLAYVRARGAGGRARLGWAGLALGSAYLAFACKETYAVLPLLALVLEAFLFPGLGERLRRNAGVAAAGGAAAVAGGAALLWAHRVSYAAESARHGIPLADRLLSQPRVLLHYLSLLALPLPSRLQVDHDWPPSRGLLDPPGTLLALLALAALVAAAIAARRRAPLLAFAVAWYLAALAVEQTVLPIDLVFEHRLYLPSFGPLVAAAAAVERLAGGRAARWAAVAPVLAALAWGTHLRNEAWNDPLRLYADGGSTRTRAGTLLTLADEQRRAGRLDEAEATLRKVIALEPRSAPAHVNLGMVAWARGDLAGAERWLRASIALEPTAEAWYDLGCLLADARRYEEAEAALGQALAGSPGFVRAHVNLASLALRRGDLPGALAHLDEAIRIDPGYALAYQNRALLGLRSGRGVAAVEDARAAARLAPGSAEAHAVLGDVLRANGPAAEAAAAYDRALALDPRSARAAAGRAALGR